MHSGVLLIVALLLSANAAARTLPSLFHTGSRAPVILVPGLGGSVLESKLEHVREPHWICKSTHDWDIEWVTPNTVALIDCLLHNMELSYDRRTGRYQNQTGVQIRPYRFGRVEGVAAIDPELPNDTRTYAPLIEALGHAGYRECTNMFAAPYDFRLAADGLEQIGWYQHLRNLIEEAVAKNHGQPAILITHSMGGLVVKYLLDKMATDAEAEVRDWIPRHIAGLIAMAAPWEGAVTSMKGQISGDNFDLPLPHALLRPVQKTSPSGPWLFPRAAVWKDEVLVETRGGDKYTARDAARLLRDLNLTQQVEVLPLIQDLIQPLKPVQVPVHCLYGTNMPTESGYIYDVGRFSGAVPPAPGEIRHGPGDGTVNLRSLRACTKLGPQVKLHEFFNVSHSGILTSDHIIDTVVDLVFNLQNSRASGSVV